MHFYSRGYFVIHMYDVHQNRKNCTSSLCSRFTADPHCMRSYSHVLLPHTWDASIRKCSTIYREKNKQIEGPRNWAIQKKCFLQFCRRQFVLRYQYRSLNHLTQFNRFKWNNSHQILIVSIWKSNMKKTNKSSDHYL